MRTSRRLVAGLAVVAAVGLVFAGCSKKKEDSTTTSAASGAVKCDQELAIGFFGALTGDNAQLGINIQQGAKLAIDQWNAGNPDCQVTLEDFDSQGSPDQAPALATEAVSNDAIVGVVGPAFSGESRAANPIFDEAGLPIITPSATNPALSTNGWTIFHRGVANDNAQGPAAAAYIGNTLKATKAAVIDDGSEYGKGLADIVRESLTESSITVGTSESIDPNASDFSTTVNKIKEENPEVVYFGGYYEEAGQLVKQLRDAGVEAKFMSGDGSYDNKLIESSGTEAAEGVIATCPCAPETANETFASAYEEAFGEAPGTYSAEGYDAANLFLEAIKGGSQTREAINTFLSTVEYTGVTKTYKFAENGEIDSISVYVYTVEGGKFGSGELIEA